MAHLMEGLAVETKSGNKMNNTKEAGSVELPSLPERDANWAGDDWYMGVSMREYARQAVDADRAARTPVQVVGSVGALHGVVVKALANHRMINTFEDDGYGNGYPLVDHLCAEDARDIESGAQEIEAIADAITDALDAARIASPAAAPIDMILHCPSCGKQHIDAPDARMTPAFGPGMDVEPWANPPHRSHLCHGCGHIWRPADVPTNGVKSIKTTGNADSPTTSMQGEAVGERAAEAVYNCLTGSKAHPWQPGGNSHKQDEARMYARAALATIPAATSKGEAHPVIELLLDVARLAYDAMDNTAEESKDNLVWNVEDFVALSDAMDKLEALPDDQPGIVMGPAAKAAWAMRNILAATSQPAAPAYVTLSQQQLSDYRARVIAETVEKFASAPDTAAVRDQALEEAAALAEDMNSHGQFIAEAIRALRTPSTDKPAEGA